MIDVTPPLAMAYDDQIESEEVPKDLTNQWS